MLLLRVFCWINVGYLSYWPGKNGHKIKKYTIGTHTCTGKTLKPLKVQRTFFSSITFNYLSKVTLILHKYITFYYTVQKTALV